MKTMKFQKIAEQAKSLSSPDLKKIKGGIGQDDIESGFVIEDIIST